jgi:carbonic anhydrase
MKEPDTVQVFPARGVLGRILSTEGIYDIVRFHFHTPSEHLIRGNEFPVEMHFVGVRTGGSGDPGLPVNGDNAVFALMLEYTDKSPNNGPLARIFDAIPTEAIDPTKACPVRSVNADLSSLVGKAAVSTYIGSLTTPPCTEGLRWYIAFEPAEISKSQYARLMQGMPKGSSARPRQKRNGRAFGVRLPAVQ